MFNSEPFNKAWELWKKHKTELSQRAYTQTAEESALSALFWQSNGVEDLAIASIKNSIDNNWAKIYIVKNYNKNTNGQAGENNGQLGFRNSVQEELNKRFGSGG